MIITLMAPELLNDIGTVPFIRDATPSEIETFRNDHPQLDHIDSSGRPYFAVVIDETHPECPPSLAEKAKITLRMRWL